MTRHLWHPAIVHFPVACWVLATFLDVGHLLFLDSVVAGTDVSAASPLLLWIGLVAAVPAVGAGLLDYTALPRTVQDSKELLAHILCMASAVLVFLAAALWRARLDDFASPEALYVIAMELAGSALLVAGGHLSAVVVYRRIPEAAAEPQLKGRPRSR